jgi:hypothetical protein
VSGRRAHGGLLSIPFLTLGAHRFEGKRRTSWSALQVAGERAARGNTEPAVRTGAVESYGSCP